MALSPMMQQYFEIKDEYPGTILFFRLGDFYEMFFEDARLVSRELDLTLTGRDCGQEERAPMCGVPFHSADTYIARLVAKGYKVAICEQMEDPAKAKGLVKRDVIRVITPGTVIEGHMLDESRNNYLAVVVEEEGQTGICFGDVSTGELHLTVVNGENELQKVQNELARFHPSEVLLNAKAAEHPELQEFLKERLEASTEVMDDSYFEPAKCETYILTQLRKSDLDDAGLSGYTQGVKALGAALCYLMETQKSDLSNVQALDFYEETQFMQLDISARRNLELTETMRTGEKKHSLLWVLDKTKTAMGKRLIRSWLEQPLLSPAAISRRQNAVGELAQNGMLRDDVMEWLTGINDLERLMTRVVYGTANAKELKALSYTIGLLPGIKQRLAGCSSKMMQEIEQNLDLLQDVYSLIESAIVDDPPFSIREGGLIKAGYSEEVDSLHEIMADGKGVIARVEQTEQEKTGIKKLKVGYNRVFGYFIEVTNSYKDQVPQEYIRKQTLTNCERYITQELKELESKVLGAKERAISLEGELFADVREKVAAQLGRIQQTAHALAKLDTLCSLAQVAVQQGYVCPQIGVDGVVDIRDGRHPVVEKMLKGAPFVPNDTYLDLKDDRVAIITGPNMAGKSTYMRQTAIIILLAQIGSFVPASSAKISVVDSIFTRVGASDDLASGQSTFMVEMNEVAHILKNATQRSLIVLDEIGRGTSTFDGMSIARAVLEYVASKKSLGAKTLFATHYHELTALEGEISGVKNYNIAVKKRGDDITFLRRIIRGGADDSFGIEVAKLAGVPESVVRRAKVVLKELEAENPTGIPVVKRAAPLEEAQTSFTATAKDELIEKLKYTDFNTLTPIEAMTMLFDLQQQAKQI